MKVVQPKPNPTVKAEWVTVVCVNAATCGDHGKSVPQSIASEYAQKRIRYLCHKCIAIGVKSAAQSTLVTNAGQERNKIFDSYGRIDHWRKEV